MTVVGVTMVWNESDLIEFTVRHMLDQVDYVIVADNRSTDDTRAILESIGDPRLFVVDEPEFGYCQDRVMNALADSAQRDLGATWIVPFDADEWWAASSGTIKDVLADVDSDGVMVGICATVPQPTDDPNEPNPFRRCVSRRGPPAPRWRVVYRPAPGRVLGMGNHVTSDSARWPSEERLLIRHLPYRSFEQALAKSRHDKAAMDATNLDDAICNHWRVLGAASDENFEVFWRNWIDPAGLIYDPLP
jgi:glycosyltransferase involved in cell wall biosynthesis